MRIPTTLLLSALLLGLHASQGRSKTGAGEWNGGTDGGIGEWGTTGQALRRALASSSDRHFSAPANITATYKGDWRKVDWPEELAGASLLQQGSGLAVLKLRSVGLLEGGVVNVEGEMVLRDGQYVSQGDTLLRLQGVHVPAAGRLMAVVEPARAVRLPVPPHLEQKGWQLGGQERTDLLAQPGQRQVGDDLLTDRWRWRDELLRTAALRVAAVASKGQAAGLGLSDLPDPAGAFEEAPARHVCQLMLDLRLRVRPEAAAQGQRAAGRARQQGWPGASAHEGGMLPRSRGGQHHLLLAPNGLSAGDMVLNGTLVSRGCAMHLTLNLATAHAEEYYSKAVNYTLMITALGFLQVLLLVRQMEACSTPALASRVSLLTLAHQAVLDAYLCLVHLTLGIMIESLFHSFGTIAVLQFVVFAIFEMRFLLSVWRARRGSVDPWTAQREVSVLYARFYAALLGGILVTYQLQRHVPLLLFGFSSYWWPQIVLCAQTDCRSPLRPEFVLGTSAARLALPLYVFACPSNLLRVQPSLGLCAALAVYVGLQCGLLMAQHWWGPRCFIPKLLLPCRYDYSRPLPAPVFGGIGAGDIERGDGSRECVICMTQVDVCNKSERAVTPCAHIFHRSCLERWLSYKPDCPTCRRSLPPL